MGFVVSQPIETFLGETFDSFYVRIENYLINKPSGVLGISVAHYESPEAASSNFSKYIGDQSFPSGRIPTSMSYNGESKDWPMYYEYPLAEEVIVPTIFYSSSFYTESVDYIDFDDAGNEVIKTKDEVFEVVTSSSIDTPKMQINLDLITGSLYDFAYDKIKKSYGELFGNDNIIDII